MDRKKMIEVILNEYRTWEKEKQLSVLESSLKSMSDANLIGLTRSLGLYERADVFSSIFPYGVKIMEVE